MNGQRRLPKVMEADSKQTANNNTNALSSFFAMLGVWQIIAVTLKLAGDVDWSWWIVFVPTLVVLGMLVAAFVAGLIAQTIMLRRMKKSMDKMTRD
jgi:uncharacterized membrane protein YhaH (DUF805 family)